MRGMKSEKTSKGINLGANGRMTDSTFKRREKNILKGALATNAAQDDCRRLGLLVDLSMMLTVAMKE